MRVALVAPDCNKRDGQARYVAEIAERLAPRHEVHVFSVGFADTDPGRVRHRPLRAPRGRARARFFALLWTASRAVGRERWDVVHALGASCLAPDLVTAQFCQAAWDEVLRTEAPALAGGPLDHLLRRAVSAVERRVFARPATRRLIVVSRRVATDVARFYGRSDGVVVLPQGVDLERFHPRRREGAAELRHGLGLPPGAVMVLFLGEFERKNLVTLIDALARARDPRLHLVAAGGSDPAPYRRLAVELGVGPRTHFAPRTAEPERWMAAADVFAFPTLYDPYGTVTLEAAACGTAVLTSGRPGFAEAIEDGVSGMIVDHPLDAAALALRLDRLAGSPELRQALGNAGRSLAEGYSWESVARATEQVWEEVRSIKSGGSARGPAGPARFPPEGTRD